MSDIVNCIMKQFDIGWFTSKLVNKTINSKELETELLEKLNSHNEGNGEKGELIVKDFLNIIYKFIKIIPDKFLKQIDKSWDIKLGEENKRDNLISLLTRFEINENSALISNYKVIKFNRDFSGIENCLSFLILNDEISKMAMFDYQDSILTRVDSLITRAKDKSKSDIENSNIILLESIELLNSILEYPGDHINDIAAVNGKIKEATDMYTSNLVNQRRAALKDSTNSKGGMLEVIGGNKPKAKNKKQKRKSKSLKFKSRKTKNLKTKNRKTKNRKTKNRKTKNRKNKNSNYKSYKK